MPLLEIKITDKRNPITNLLINKKPQKLRYKGFSGAAICYYHHTGDEPLQIFISSKPATKGDKFLFLLSAFVDIADSGMKHFLESHCEFIESEYEITLTGDTELRIEAEKDGFLLAEHSDTCQVIAEKHDVEKISKKLYRAALAPVFVLISIPLLFLLALGIAFMVTGNYDNAVLMFALTTALTLLFGYLIRKTFKSRKN